MILQGKRIRNFAKHFGYLKEGQRVTFGVGDANRFEARLRKVGFPDPVNLNDTVLPATACGPVCRYNAEGKQIIRRDLPKETAYRQVEWSWNEWHGKQQVEQSDTKDVPYERYPRDFVPPPAIEISVAQAVDGSTLVVGPMQEVDGMDTAALLHTVNVFLEIFGECQAFTEEGAAILRAPQNRLNWQVLPPGRRPWPQLRQEVDLLMRRLSDNKQKVAARRFETINGYDPDFVATGRAGFSGYVVFGFTAKNLFLCESMYTGNATYVFAEDWAALSQMTKADILSQDLQEDRIIHREGWALKIADLLR